MTAEICRRGERSKREGRGGRGGGKGKGGGAFPHFSFTI